MIRQQEPTPPQPSSWTVDDPIEVTTVEALVTSTYADLTRIAAGLMARERGDHLLDPSALVHETYFRLRAQRRTRWRNKRHFLAIAKRMMGRVLIDHARRRTAGRRGGGAVHLTLDSATRAGSEFRDPTLRLLLERLARIDREASDVLTLKILQGLSIAEISATVGVSRRSVSRRWRRATSWLRTELRPCAT